MLIWAAYSGTHEPVARRSAEAVAQRVSQPSRNRAIGSINVIFYHYFRLNHRCLSGKCIFYH